MKTPIEDRVIIVTGGASGIGAALCKAFIAAGARAVVCADRDGAGAQALASSLGDACVARECDVSAELHVKALVDFTVARWGHVDVYVSNAGIMYPFAHAREPVTAHSTEQWQRIWAVNVLAHVHAMRALLPGWLARREGHFLVTASAAGLLSQIGDASYAVTKHAAVAFAECVAITHGDAGIRAYCLCPQAVATPFANGQPKDNPATGDGVVTPDFVADVVMEHFHSGEFLVRARGAEPWGRC